MIYLFLFVIFFLEDYIAYKFIRKIDKKERKRIDDLELNYLENLKKNYKEVVK